MDKAKEHFNENAEKYESLIKKIVTNHDIFFNTVVDLVPGDNVEILELGSGTGYLTEKILAGNPNASITCIDMTPEMIGIAMEKESLKEVDFIEGDFRKVWPDKKFDVILSTLCFHHLNDADRKEIIKKIHESLIDNGIFINGDVFKPDDAFIEDILNKRWLESMIKNGLAETQAKDMIEKRKNAFAFIDTQTGYMKKLMKAGFRRAFPFYSYGIYSVYAAYK
ncbi:MAG: class I SAM-dependent methyltransferase [Methanomicrobiaceae archaeon]|nr:class I SAM-dependent methyltransferase [Methanomicrobiaceae archaeon]